jgi:hypothetical protein
MEAQVFLGVFLFLGTTGWMLYELNVTRKVRRGLREKADVALLVRLRNGAIVILLYSLACICFLNYSLTLLAEESSQYQVRSHVIEFLIGMSIASAGFAVSTLILQDVVMTRLKQKVRERAWKLKFQRGRQRSKPSKTVTPK